MCVSFISNGDVDGDGMELRVKQRRKNFFFSAPQLAWLMSMEMEEGEGTAREVSEVLLAIQWSAEPSLNCFSPLGFRSYT
jgi:hypothetical protein